MIPLSSVEFLRVARLLGGDAATPRGGIEGIRVSLTGSGSGSESLGGRLGRAGRDGVGSSSSDASGVYCGRVEPENWRCCFMIPAIAAAGPV